MRLIICLLLPAALLAQESKISLYSRTGNSGIFLNSLSGEVSQFQLSVTHLREQGCDSIYGGFSSPWISLGQFTIEGFFSWIENTREEYSTLFRDSRWHMKEIHTTSFPDYSLLITPHPRAGGFSKASDSHYSNYLWLTPSFLNDSLKLDIISSFSWNEAEEMLIHHSGRIYYENSFICSALGGTVAFSPLYPPGWKNKGSVMVFNNWGSVTFTGFLTSVEGFTTPQMTLMKKEYGGRGDGNIILGNFSLDLFYCRAVKSDSLSQTAGTSLKYKNFILSGEMRESLYSKKALSISWKASGNLISFEPELSLTYTSDTWFLFKGITELKTDSLYLTIKNWFRYSSEAEHKYSVTGEYKVKDACLFFSLESDYSLLLKDLHFEIGVKSRI